MNFLYYEMQYIKFKISFSVGDEQFIFLNIFNMKNNLQTFNLSEPRQIFSLSNSFFLSLSPPIFLSLFILRKWCTHFLIYNILLFLSPTSLCHLLKVLHFYVFGLISFGIFFIINFSFVFPLCAPLVYAFLEEEKNRGSLERNKKERENYQWT